MKRIIKVLAISFLFLAALTGCSKEKTYGLNEDVYVKNLQGEYRIKITDVERKVSKKNENYVEITFEVENISISGSLEKDVYHFMAYDKKGKSCSSYLILGQNNLKANKGEKYQIKMGYYLDSNDNYIKLDYSDNYLSGNKDLTFVLEW